MKRNVQYSLVRSNKTRDFFRAGLVECGLELFVLAASTAQRVVVLQPEVLHALLLTLTLLSKVFHGHFQEILLIKNILNVETD